MNVQDEMKEYLKNIEYVEVGTLKSFRFDDQCYSIISLVEGYVIQCHNFKHMITSVFVPFKD